MSLARHDSEHLSRNRQYRLDEIAQHIMSEIMAKIRTKKSKMALCNLIAPAAVLTLSCATQNAQTGLNSPPASAKVTTNVEAKAQPMEKTSPATTNPRGTNITQWWPNRLDLRVLKANAPKGDPVDDSFSYREAFASLNLDAVKQDITTTLKDSKTWWPADWGHYGGLMIRLAWHSAGTYRVTDGRGGAASGTIRFAPLNSWPDNANLDKARRLLWPVKKKYGRSLSWADLMILTGNVALESMGFKTFGFGGGREDVYEPTDINWGPEIEWLANARFSKDGSLKKPLGASQMGLIYVNPEGPGGNPDPLEAAKRIRLTFGRMAMNDEETVALIAGGHTMGKAHGAASPRGHVGPEPEGAPLQAQGTGWNSSYGSGKGADTITSGLEGAWTSTPTRWSHGYLQNLYKYEWVLTKSPAGAQQWEPKDGPRSVPDAHDPSKFHKPIMFTTDLALREDPAYREVSQRFLKDPAAFELAFAKAWYKLTHRDMGPYSRLVGSEVPEPQVWQDPIPELKHPLLTSYGIKTLKKRLLNSGILPADLIRVAWAAASSYRDTDLRGGANGGRLRLAPQKDWAVNRPEVLSKLFPKYSKLQKDYNATNTRKVSLADLYVLGGNAAIEQAAKRGGHTLELPFTPGRTDAAQTHTDVASFNNLRPTADGFRNYLEPGVTQPAPELLIDKADMLGLTAPEMTVLVGGLRVLDANFDGSKHGVFTTSPGTLTNDFFSALMDLSIKWEAVAGEGQVYQARDEKTGTVKWTGTSVDLVFGSNSQLRAIVEVYAADDAKQKFVKDFGAAWTKVMNLDRFDKR